MTLEVKTSCGLKWYFALAATYHLLRFWNYFSDIPQSFMCMRIFCSLLRSFLWPLCVVDADIVFLPRLPCGFYLSIFLFFLAKSQRSEIGCLPYFHTWCGLSANLECRSETCCTRLAENTGRKKSPVRHHHTTLSGCIFATKACIDNRKTY